MIDTILFDLDGTLLPVGLKEFTAAYFAGIKKAFFGLGLDVESAFGALWGGTEAMMKNDGTMTNAARFWEHFAAALKLPRERLGALEASLDRFYASEDFDGIQALLRGDLALSRRVVETAGEKGYDLVLATNPLFPMIAVTMRLKWLGIDPAVFRHVTDYTRSSYCKPNNAYYREIFEVIGKTPGQCLMVGNNTKEDMCAGELGVETYLVTDYLENEPNMDIEVFRHGSLAELEAYLGALPNLRAR